MLADLPSLMVKKCGKSRIIADYSGYLSKKVNKSGMFADNIGLFAKNVNKSGMFADKYWGMTVIFKKSIINPELLRTLFGPSLFVFSKISMLKPEW